MNKTELYIEEYKKLEAAVRSAYNLNKEDSIYYYLKNEKNIKNTKMISSIVRM